MCLPCRLVSEMLCVIDYFDDVMLVGTPYINKIQNISKILCW